MKLFLILALTIFHQTTYGQKPATVIFTNDYKDVYHLSLIIYTPDGKGQTRVSNVDPGQTKTYTYPVGTRIFVADWKQEAFAMKGNDIRETGTKPTFVLTESTDKIKVMLSTLPKIKDAMQPASL